MVLINATIAAFASSGPLIERAFFDCLDKKKTSLIPFAGVLGLMLPATPSGIGTLHASVVSAFIFLGRSPAERLLMATPIHLLFFVA